MATVEDCERALLQLAERLAAVDPEVRGRYVVTRTLACRIPDLDVVFTGTIGDDGIEQIRWESGTDTSGAQVRMAAASDDLVSLVKGELSPPVAWATGRLKVQASPLDLLKLRGML